MKVLDTTAFKEYVKEEVETNGGVTDEVKETIISKLKVIVRSNSLYLVTLYGIDQWW